MSAPTIHGTRDRAVIEWDGDRFPCFDVRSIYVADPTGDRGWVACLPVENGAVVQLIHDPESDPDEVVSLWLYVRTEHGLVGARVYNTGKIRWSPDCLSDNCPGCYHDVGMWWRYVAGPSQLREDWRYLGSLALAGPDTVRAFPPGGLLVYGEDG